MEGLRQWAYSVAATVVFGTLAETVLPSDSYRKYIRLILGMVLLLTLTKPAAALISGGLGEAAEEYAASFSAAEERTEREADEIEQKQKNDIIKIYKDSLESSVAAGIERKCGAVPTRVEAEISDSVFGSLEGMTIETEAADASKSAAIKAAAAEMTGLASGKITVKERGAGAQNGETD